MAKNINRKVTIYINGREVENTIQSIRNEVVKLEREQRKLPIGSEEYLKKGKEIAELKTILKQQEINVQDLGNAWKDATFKMAEYSNILMGVQSSFQMIDLGIGKIKDLAKDAAALDDAYGQVMKTTGLTHEQVEQLNEAFEKMDTRTSREQLNQLAYEAGKLGIQGVKDVAAFVDASDKINVALGDVLGDGAMVTIGKMAGVYAGSTKELADATGDLNKQMLAIGSAVNELGKLSTANEHYLVDFAGRMGGIAVQAGLSADQILGFASALDQDMQKVEMSATAFQKFIGQIMKKPEEFAKQAGMAVADFSQLVRTDLNEALFRVLQGFSGKGGYAELVNIFKDLGLDGARAASVISAMSNSIDKIRVAQSAANEQLRSGQSILGEYDTMNNTRQAQAEKAKKRFEETRIELGNELYPVLIKLQRSGTVLMKGVAGTIQLFKEAPALIIPVVSAIIAWNRYRLLSIATSGKLTDVLKRLVGISKIEAVTAAFQEKSERKLTAAKEAARLKSLQSMLATEKETLARQLASKQTVVQELATKTKNRVYSLEVQVTEQATRAELAHAAATKASRSALMSVPWGMILAAVSAIIVGVTKLVKKTNEVKNAAKEIANAGAEAEAKVRVLQDRLEESKKGTDDYRKALEELKEMYPDIVKQFMDEKGALDDVKGALEAVSIASKQAAMDQMYNQKAGEIYSNEAKKIQEAMAVAREISQKTSLAFWKDGTTNAQREEAWRRYTDWVRKAQAGTVSWDDAIKGAQKDLGEMGYVLTSTFGSGSNDMIYQMREMKKATEETDGKVRELNETLKNVYGYNNQTTAPAVKSIRDIELEIKNLEARSRLTQNEIDRLKKKLKGEKNEASKNVILLRIKEWSAEIDRSKKKIEELKKELESQRKKENPESNTSNQNYSGKETPAQKKARLAQEAWERFENSYDRLMEKMEAKTTTGAAKVVADVDNGLQKMYDDLQMVLKKHPEAQQKIDKLQEKAVAWKKEQLDQYIKKMTDELAKQQGKLKETDESGNAYINKMMEAQRKLVETFTTYDNAIAQANADITTLEALQAKASGKEADNLKSQIQNLRDLIAQYGILKGQMQARVFDAIDTSDVKASRLSGDETQWGADVQNTVNDSKSVWTGALFDKADFEAYGKALDDIRLKYEKQQKAISEAKAANDAMLEVLRAKAKADPENEDLKEKISLREQEAQRLADEQTKLDGLLQTANEAAKKDAFGQAIDKWITGIDKFGSAAIEIWGNINKIFDNIKQQELNGLKKQHEAATKELDEQLAEGIISQDEYNEQVEAMNQEYEEKEKEAQIEAWKRQKLMNVSQATMEAALAVLKAWNSAPWPYNAIPVGIATALGAAQIAAVASEPQPYARGGYVDSDTTFYRAGEAGREWIASNSLLNDPYTASIIERLDAYQRGNSRALADIPMATLDMPAAAAAAAEIGRRQVVVRDIAAPAWQGQPQVSSYDDSKMVELMEELTHYMKDPRNRQAVISRRTMQDFDKDEDFLRSRARL